MREKQGVFVKHEACIGEECSSSDAMAIYAQEDGSFDAACFSCGGYFSNDQLQGAEIDLEFSEEEVKKKKREPITRAELLVLQQETVFDHTNYRGIKQYVNEFYGVRTKIVNGQVVERHYPVTKDGKPSAYKKRVHPKDFTKGYLGYNGNDCDMFGSVRFPKGGKYLLICEGEEDVLAAFQMLRDDQLRRNKDSYQPVAVVGPSTGGNCERQIKANYEYITSFERIILCMDQDEVGKKVTENLLKILPPDKAFVMHCPEKDPNKCVEVGREVEFVRAFYSAARYNPTGIVGSGDLIAKVREYAKTPRLELPPFLTELQKMQAGGIPLGTIINLASGSGTGKSTLVNEKLYHWMFHSRYRMGVCPLEGGLDYFGESMLSRHIGLKLALISDPKEKLALLDSPEIRKKEQELYYDDFGDHRFDLIDGNGHMDLEKFKKNAEYLVRAKDVKVLVVDTLTKLIEGEPTDAVYKFLKWQNDFVVHNKCIIINICQVRKNHGSKKANSRGADLSEEDISGLGVIFQTGACNILFMRDKEAEDPVIRNSTRIVMSKCRWSGITGPAGTIYYDNETHTLHDKGEYFSSMGGEEGIAEQEEELRAAGAFETSEEGMPSF